ncbi:MAG: hypothetical protein ABL958_02165 [Bdellovibrionia bacterium]
MNDSNLPQVLRWLGVVAILGAGVSFMLEGWSTLNSVEKYSAFLGFSLVLSLCGWAARKYFNDETGAKTFFGTAAAAATVNFVQLGAFMYSSVIGEAVNLPEIFQLQAPEEKTLIGLITVTLAVSVPMIWTGFRAMVPKPSSEMLAGLFFLLNTMFLIPSREPAHMAWVILIAFALMAYVFRKLPILEGWPAALATVPFFVLVGRSLFHPADSVLYASLSFVSSILIFWIGGVASKNREASAFVQGISIVPMFFGWAYTADAYRALGARDTVLLVSTTLTVMSFMSAGGGGFYRGFASILGVLAFAPAFFYSGFNVQAIVLSLAVSIIAIVLGYAKKEKIPFFTGLVAFAWFMVHHLWHAVRLQHLNLWFILGLIGVIILTGATVLEKKYKNLVQPWSDLKREFLGWN